MHQPANLNRLTRHIASSIEDNLSRSGILFRISSRSKSADSIQRKFTSKSYDGKKKFLQDVIGIRVNLFFIDDLVIVHEFLKSATREYQFLSETVDKNQETEFKPTRINIVFKIPSDFIEEFSDIVSDPRIDKTFEVQLRTVLSEGWHEVDHDLRYKCSDDWTDHADLSRFFNGILASLETSDWSILNLFNEISYRHYKSKKWSAMLRTRLRIRVSENDISDELIAVIRNDSALQKSLFRVDRRQFIKHMLEEKYFFPLRIDNIIYLINYLFLKHKGITAVTPVEVLEIFQLEEPDNL